MIMLRYIKVNNRWLDTLSAQQNYHLVYIVIEGKVNCIYKDCDMTYIGELQEETDDVKRVSL